MRSPRILALCDKRHVPSKMTSPLTWISQSDTWMQVYTDTRKNEDWLISKNKAWAALPSKESFLHSFRKTCSKEYQTCPVWIPTHAARVHTTLKAMSNDKHTGIFLAWLHEMARIASTTEWSMANQPDPIRTEWFSAILEKCHAHPYAGYIEDMALNEPWAWDQTISYFLTNAIAGKGIEAWRDRILAQDQKYKPGPFIIQGLLESWPPHPSNSAFQMLNRQHAQWLNDVRRHIEMHHTLVVPTSPIELQTAALMVERMTHASAPQSSS